MDTSSESRNAAGSTYKRGAFSDDVVLRPRTELSREKDVYKYLYSWADLHRPPNLYRHVFPHKDQSLPSPTASSDTALSAFAQLCTLRLNVRRALISLISGSTEYVLTEATRSMSLQYDAFDDAGDTPWIGCCSFSRTEGLNDLALDGWRSAREYRRIPDDGQHYYVQGLSPHWCIFSDVRGSSEHQSRSFVARSPNLRFFCSIPLRDTNGSVVGALSIMDDKPRYGLSASEMLFLEDSADTVMEHLEATVIRAQRQRSQRLIRALGVFNNRKSSIKDWWVEQDNERLRRGGRDQDTTQDQVGQQSRLDREFGIQDGSSTSIATARRLRRQEPLEAKQGSDSYSAQSPTGESNTNAASARANQNIRGYDFGDSSQRAAQRQPEFLSQAIVEKLESGKERTKDGSTKAHGDSETENIPPTSQSVDPARNAYARASNLIREAMSVQGVVFVDAKAASASFRNSRHVISRSTSRSSSDDSIHSEARSDAQMSGPSDGDTSDQSLSAKSSRVIAFSTRNRSTLAGAHSSSHYFALSQNELRGLIKRYPVGKIFNFAESGEIYSSTGEELSGGSSEDAEGRQSKRQSRRNQLSRDALRLGKIMTGARTIAFLPIRDEDSDTFGSVIFVWSTTPLRYFETLEDLTYLSSFSHSLTAELAHLQAKASDSAKGTFISSISHELRSPLHGILAGAELLQETELSPFQREMNLAVTMAGRTLLDTVNNVLDFSKLNKPRPPRRKYHKPQRNAELMETNDHGSLPVTNLARLTEDVVETVVSAHRFQLLSRQSRKEEEASLSRTPINSPVTPNAHNDEISVTLNIDKRENWKTRISPGAWTRIITNLLGNSLKYTRSGVVAVTLSAVSVGHRPTVELVVQDTGIGMSQQFLADGLFTPYKQVDSTSTGLGLGLSIVKKIISDLGARLDIKSESGKGTRATIKLDIDLSKSDGEESDEEDRQLMHDVAQFNPRHFHGLKPNESSFSGAQSLFPSVLNNARSWLPGKTTSGPGVEFDEYPAICGIEESDLPRLADGNWPDQSELMTKLASEDVQIVVLASSCQSLSSKVVFEGFRIEPIFVHQPIGPRKLLRAILMRNKQTGSATTHTPREFSLYDTTKKIVTPLIIHSGVQGQTGERDTLGYFRLIQTKMLRKTRTPGPTGCEETAAGETNDRVSTDETSRENISSEASDDKAQRSATTTLPAGFNGHSPCEQRSSVLLVEDNPINMQLLKALISKLDLPFNTAVNGLEALNMFSDDPSKYFLILTDISMPVMDGNECCAKIRDLERKRKLPRIKIVAVTGVTNAASRKTSLDSGIDQYLTKPVKMKALRDLVESVKGS